MDKILYRNPSKSEVIGCCGGDEKTEWSRRTDKSRTLKKTQKTINHNGVAILVISRREKRTRKLYPF